MHRLQTTSSPPTALTPSQRNKFVTRLTEALNGDVTPSGVPQHLRSAYGGGKLVPAGQIIVMRGEVESIQDRVRFNVVTAWGALEASKAAVIASQKAVIANERALAGVREEAAIGQRTTLDVLNAQQELLLARVGLVSAQRDRVIASYQVVFSMGQLTAKFLDLTKDVYEKKIHYDQVKDLWFGVRSPDGR